MPYLAYFGNNQIGIPGVGKVAHPGDVVKMTDARAAGFHHDSRFAPVPDDVGLLLEASMGLDEKSRTARVVVEADDPPENRKITLLQVVDKDGVCIHHMIGPQPKIKRTKQKTVQATGTATGTSSAGS